jgi:3-deoxy-D-manno-octulosonic acid kinase
MDETRAAGTSNQQRIAETGFRDARGRGAIVFDPSRLRQVDWSLLDPGTYGTAEPVGGEGGRGGAWFVQSDAGPAVLKHYLRGGRMARLNRDAYLWLGGDRVRSVREFVLLSQMREAGLPVPAPLAAGWRRNGLVYCARLMTQRLPGVESFVAAVRRRGAEAPWAAVGATLARFHDRGLHHADLNAHNVLLGRDDTVHVIDWDKARTEDAPGAWCGRVLARLERSLRKQLPDVEAALLAAGMARLREAHARGLAA